MKLGFQLDGVTIVDPHVPALVDKYADALVEARKKKGMTKETAVDMLQDVNYFGTMMVRCGDADGMVSGAAHTTAATIRPGLQVHASHAFMCLPSGCVTLIFVQLCSERRKQCRF
jgi:phosphotransacetylase